MRSVFNLIISWFKRLAARLLKKDVTDDPGFDDPQIDPGEVVCYYGCPNSKKAKKLQLEKTAVR